MSLRVRIRAAALGDIPVILEIERESYGTPWSEQTFRELLERPSGTIVLVAEVGRSFAGYAVCWSILGEGELGNLAVDPAWRGRGIGGRLLDKALDEARRSLQARVVRLEVRVSNVPALLLYERRGFKRIGKRLDYYTNPVEDADIMERSL